eukprot:scaffold1081_cov219-Pinguiococcus_pyrenoidosus.AAC.4
MAQSVQRLRCSGRSEDANALSTAICKGEKKAWQAAGALAAQTAQHDTGGPGDSASMLQGKALQALPGAEEVAMLIRGHQQRRERIHSAWAAHLDENGTGHGAKRAKTPFEIRRNLGSSPPPKFRLD